MFLGTFSKSIQAYKVGRNGVCWMCDRHMKLILHRRALNKVLDLVLFPFALDCHNYYELMVAQGEGRSPMTSSDAETNSKPIIIIILLYAKFKVS